MLLTWAGSQATKLLRAGAAITFAPLVDRLLDAVVARLGLKGKGQGLGVIAVVCISAALLMFGLVVLAWS
jgi:hypothetical protein